MTLTEKVVCEIYTGTVFCIGDERKAIYKYTEKLLGRPVFTHELSDKKIATRLKNLAYKDFCTICSGNSLNFKY